MKFVRSIIAAIFLSFLSLNAGADVYTVQDAADIQAYTNMLAPGDVLEIPAGQYVIGSWTISGRNGTAEQPISIRGVGGQAVIVGTAYNNVVNVDNSSHIEMRNLSITNDGTYMDIDGIKFRTGVNHDFLIEDCVIFDVTGICSTSQCIELYNVTMRNCELTGARYSGIYWGSQDGVNIAHDCVIEHNYIHDMLVDESNGTGYGIQLKHNSYRNVIRDNVLVNAGGANRVGIAVYSAAIDGSRPVADNNVVEGNLVWGARGAAIWTAGSATIENNIVIDSAIGIHSHQYSNTMTNIIIRNNTVYRCNERGLYLQQFNTVGADCIIANNAVYMENLWGTAMRAPDGLGSATVAANVYYGNLHNFTRGAVQGRLPYQDFVSAGPGLAATELDLYPSADSALIDAGTADHGAPAEDFDGRDRPGSGIDAGAYERTTPTNTGWHIAEEFKDVSGPDDTPFGDVNASGRVDAADVQLVINSALRINTGYDCDLDASGEVDAIDVQLVINAVLGLI